MKTSVLVRLALVAFALFAPLVRAQVPASPPAPGLIVVNVPLLLPPKPGEQRVADIAHVEVRVVPGTGGAYFTQRVPADAPKLLAAVTAAIEKIHPGKLRQRRIEITYTGMVSAADLAASGLGLAVGLDATLGGWKPDPDCMAMGTFEADGDILPVKDAIPRLLAVMKAKAKRVVMPDKQAAQVTDMMIGAGPQIFAGTQFFGLNTYEDAKVIVDSVQTPDMVKALGYFGNVQQDIAAPNANIEELLRNEDVREWLRNTMRAAPTCISARLLLRMTTGQFDTLSPEGTFYAIQNMAPTIFTVVQSNTPDNLTKLPNDVVQAEIVKLNDARKHFDQRSLPVLEAVIGYGEVVRSYTERAAASPEENLDRKRALMLTAQGVLGAMAKFRALQH